MSSALVFNTGNIPHQFDATSQLSSGDCLIVPWKFVSVPTKEMNRDWFTEEFFSRIWHIGLCDHDVCGLAVEPSYLPELKASQPLANENYNPTQPSQSEKDALGVCKANKTSHDRWLERVVDVDHSSSIPGVREACLNLTRSMGWQQELDRKVLVQNISKAPTSVRQTLAEKLLVLFLILRHDSEEARTILESDTDELLESLEYGLRFSVPPQRTKRDQSQLTSLFRVLLQLSGARMDQAQWSLNEEYTARENKDLFASVFGFNSTSDLADFDAAAICTTLSTSPVFTKKAISVRDVEAWSTEMIDGLQIGFLKGHLNLPSQVLNELDVGHVRMFKAYMKQTYGQIPSLMSSDNNILLLLTWSTAVSYGSEEDDNQPWKALEKWAKSEEGWTLYLRLTEEFQHLHSVEQLSLTMAALMNYRRLHPDDWDRSNQPITGSYIGDLVAHLRGEPLGNSGRVAEQMVFALLRNLVPVWEVHRDLILFLKTTLSRPRPRLHVLDSFCDEYLRLRFDDGLLHEPAIMKMAKIRLPELSGKNENRIDATQSETPSIQNLYIEEPVGCGHRTCRNRLKHSRTLATPSPEENMNSPYYKLMLVTNIEDPNAQELLDDRLGLYDVPNIEELSVGSLELCVVESRIATVQDTIRNILPGADIDANHDPFKPTDEEIKMWGYSTARNKRLESFRDRTARKREEGWSSVADHFEHLLLEGICGSDIPLMPGNQG